MEKHYRITCSFCKFESEFMAKTLYEAMNIFLQKHFTRNQMDALRLGIGVYTRTACNYGYFDPEIMKVELKHENGIFYPISPVMIIKLNENLAAKLELTQQ